MTEPLATTDLPAAVRGIGVGRGAFRLGVAGARDYAILVSFVALFVTLSVASSAFLTGSNILNLLDQSVATGIVACAGTIVIIGGGFDLSVGAIFAIAGVIAAKVALSFDPVAGIAAGIAAGGALGLVNGALVTVGKVNSFIATLASSLVIRGAAIAITSGLLITVNNPTFGALGTNLAASVKYSTWVFFGVVLVVWFLLDRTALGRYVYAVGGNIEASRLSGIRVGRIRATTFVLSGLAAGLAGVIIASRNITGQADSGMGLELDAIAAVVIGGTSILGGEGAVWRTVIGVLLLAMIGNGFNLLNVDPNYQRMFQGGIILAAVVIDARAGRSR